MKLQDIEEPTELMIKAMEAGIKTLPEYTVWLQGYTTGTIETLEKRIIRQFAE